MKIGFNVGAATIATYLIDSAPTKAIIALIALCVLAAPASAQEYAVRLAYYTNLRAGPSLNSDILAIAPPEEVLPVHGAQGDWLLVRYAGSVAWLADWVGFTRLEDEQRPAAPVDNCCFLGWGCAGDADWKRGYFAFQNQLCAHPGFVIDGSQTVVAQARAALDLLQELAPQWYAYADRGLDSVGEVPESYGAGVWVHLRSFNVTASQAAAGAVWLASVIVHEACHVHQFEAGQDYYGLEAERACAQLQLEALGIINPQDSFQFGLPVVLANLDDPEYQWWR